MDYIQERLAQPPKGKGGRHQEMLELSYMMSGEGWTNEEIFFALRTRYQDPDKSDKEIRDLISGAKARGPKPAEKRRSHISDIEIEGNKVYFTLSDKPEVKEVPRGIDIKPIDFLKMAFDRGGLICLNNDTRERDGKECLNGHGSFRTIEQWEKFFESEGDKVLDCTAGCWMRINAFRQEGAQYDAEWDRWIMDGTDANVADYRRLLVEFDGRPKLEQWRIYKESNLPIAFVIDSGGDSLHALVEVGASSLEEFKERQKRVYEYLEAYLDDKGNKNPSRFSRLPGVLRKEKNAYQKLIASGIGAASWEEWEADNIEDGLPDTIEGDEFLSTEYTKPPVIIYGVMRKVRKMILGAPAKGRKTWNMINLALAVGSAKRWLGFQCGIIGTNHDEQEGVVIHEDVSPGKVLYINFELPVDEMQDRVKMVRDAMGITSVNNVTFWNMRGHAADISKIVDRALARFRKRNFDLIILDPIYKCLGDRDENKAGDVTDLLNHIERMSEGMKAAIVITAHYSKGNAHDKESRDRVSGSGVFLRDPDAFITMTPVEGQAVNNPEEFEIDVELRGFKEMNQFLIKWQFPLFRKFSDVETESREGEKKQKEKDKKERGEQYALRLARLLSDEDGTSIEEWYKSAQVREAYRNKTGKFRLTVKDLLDKGLVRSEPRGKAGKDLFYSVPDAIEGAEQSSAPKITEEGADVPF
jgi:RecA-family ATPase